MATGRPALGPLTPPVLAADVALNPDGSLLATAGGPDGDLAVYRVADGHLVGTLPGHSRPDGIDLDRHTAAVEFVAQGHVYLGSIRGPIRVIDAATMQVFDAYEAPLLSSNNQIVLTDSGLLVAAGDEAAVAIDTGLGRARLRQHRRPITTERADVAAPGKRRTPRASAPAGPVGDPAPNDQSAVGPLQQREREGERRGPDGTIGGNGARSVGGLGRWSP